MFVESWSEKKIIMFENWGYNSAKLLLVSETTIGIKKEIEIASKAVLKKTRKEIEISSIFCLKLNIDQIFSI